MSGQLDTPEILQCVVLEPGKESVCLARIFLVLLGSRTSSALWFDLWFARGQGQRSAA